MDTNYEKSCDLWIESQKFYIDELEARLVFAERDVNHIKVMIEHEKKVLSDYIEQVKK